jgi:lipopolysaccharide/colanic/teichoic acid biosynthesis glycosyltransferase
MVDVAGAFFLVILTSPLLLLAMCALAVEGRPVLFGHERLGRHGARFRCWKLRTMRLDAEHILGADPVLYELYIRNGFKIPLSQDPRITRLGRWLRRSYIDELPQLFNVLFGTMSLFGPRPIVPDELRNYGKRYSDLLQVKPGLFGAWTCRGRQRPSYPERATLELDYVANRSFRRDLVILVRCIPAILSGQSWA